MSLPYPAKLTLIEATQLVADRCGVSPEEAHARLDRAFRDEELVPFGAGGKTVGAWDGAIINWDKNSITWLSPLGDGGHAHFTLSDVRVDRSYLEKWISQSLPVRQEIPPKRSNRGGRPPKYDWEAFYGEIIRLANLPDGLPPERVKLIEHMQKWCMNTWGCEPADSMLREKIAKALPRASIT